LHSRIILHLVYYTDWKQVLSVSEKEYFISNDFLVKLFEHNNWANQKIIHATEHREQMKNMLSAWGVTPPDIDGWDYAEAHNALIPISK